MVRTNPDEETRRDLLKRTAGALAVGGASLAVGTAGAATTQSDAHEGIACGDDHSEGSTFTVAERCDGTDCDTIRLTGLSPACATEEKQLFADLPGTEPTVWMNPRNGEIPPGTYRVIGAERCEQDAGECDGSDLYRLAFRLTDS